MGGKFHLKLNIGSRPIANKYHEGKMKRTLNRELKVPEIAEGKRMEPVLLARLLCAMVIAGCISASGVVCIELHARSVSYLVRHRRFTGEDTS